jgi:hypothetical protein
MLKIEEGKFAPGYVFLTEESLRRLDTMAAELEMESPAAELCSRTADDLGRQCGKLIFANTNNHNTAGLIASGLIENMNPVLVPWFGAGIMAGFSIEERELKT